MKFWELYSGKRQTLGIALIYHDPYDQFAWVQDWRFAIADHLKFTHDQDVPEFRAEESPVPTFAYEMIENDDPSVESLWYALKILTRFREWLRLAGEDY